jgi:hypothetical protein
MVLQADRRWTLLGRIDLAEAIARRAGAQVERLQAAGAEATGPKVDQDRRWTATQHLQREAAKAARRTAEAERLRAEWRALDDFSQ